MKGSAGRRVNGRYAALLACSLSLACARNERQPPSAGSAARPITTPSHPPAPPLAEPARPAPPVANVVREERSDAGLPGLKLGELADVGPAAPASAFDGGVALVSKDDRLLVARVDRSAPPARAKLESVDEPQAAFAPLARGPSVAGGAAYWVSRGRLVRRGTAAGAPLELLGEDARPSTRVSAAVLGDKTLVAYLGRPDAEGTSRARLWLEGGGSLELTPDGAGASSVALARHGDGLLAVAIDGRTGMTPVHARKITWKSGAPALEPDVVTWVAGPAQTWTEIVLGSSDGRAFAHLPIERDVTHFGLATIDLGEAPRMDAEVSFFDYPNGLDLAPAATATLCGRSYLSFARPVAKAPRSPQELVLVEAGGARALVVANARGFASVSLSAAGRGGLAVYVADGRTWARGLACE